MTVVARRNRIQVVDGITIRFTLPAVVVFFVVEGALVVWHDRADERRRRTIEFAAAVIAAGTAVYSVRLGIQTNRVSAAARFIERWNDPKSAEMRAGLRRILLEAKELPTGGSEWSADERAAAIVVALNFFEEMSIAVKSRQVEEKILRDFFETAAVRCYATLENWIKEHRTLRAHPKCFIEFERLYDRWRPRPS
ncbi:MAG: DUF4760 domain-containing protein [Acidobacteria bacterium]|nr:DUF4760 domain-containing protein [Acidobacteriota bacterium]